MGTAESSLLYYMYEEEEEGAGGGTDGSDQHAGRRDQQMADHHAGRRGAQGRTPPPPHPGTTSHHRQPRRIQAKQQQPTTTGINDSSPRPQQSPPLTLRGIVLGSCSGKTCLLRRLRGEDPFADDDNAASANASNASNNTNKRRRKMMALVPWKSKQSGQPCQLHVVEKGSTIPKTANETAAPDNDDNNDTTPAKDAAVEALSDNPDFCIVMVDPRDERSVKYAKDTVDALLNGSAAPISARDKRSRRIRDDGAPPPSRPCICVLINYIGLIKIDDDINGDDGANDGLFHTTESNLHSIVEAFTSFNTVSSTSPNDNDGGGGSIVMSIPPSVQVYPASMLTCSGLPSLHSFISLPYLRRTEARLLRDLEQVRKGHDVAASELRAGSSKAMKEAIDEGVLRMSTAPPPPSSTGRRSIIPTQRAKPQPVRARPSTDQRQSGAITTSSREKKVRIDESRNVTTSVHEVDVTQRLQKADRVRRSRRKAVEEASRVKNRTVTDEADVVATTSSGRRSIVPSKQRAVIQEMISKLPRQKQKSVTIQSADPMKALEDFLGDDSDSDVDNADSSSGSSSNNSGARASILLSDSDSEDDDFYYDETGHAHYSHLDNRASKNNKGHREEKPASTLIHEAAKAAAKDDSTDVGHASGAESDSTPPTKQDDPSDEDAKMRKDAADSEVEEENESGPAEDDEVEPTNREESDVESVLTPPTTQDEASKDAAIVRTGDDDNEVVKEGVPSSANNVEEEEEEEEEKVSVPSQRLTVQPDEAPEEEKKDEAHSCVATVEEGASEVISGEPPEDAVREVLDIENKSPSPIPQGVSPAKEEHSVAEPEKKVEVVKESDALGDENDKSHGAQKVEILHSDDDEDESPGAQKVEVFHSDDEDDSPAPSKVEILHSDDEDDPPVSSQVEILHSDDEDELHRSPNTESQLNRSNNGGASSDEEYKIGSDDSIGQKLAESSTDTLDDEVNADEDQEISSTMPSTETPVASSDADAKAPEHKAEAEAESTGMSAAALAAVAAAQEEAILMMSSAPPPPVVRERKSKSKKDGKKKTKKSKSSEDGERRKKKKKSSSKRSTGTKK